MSRRKKTKDERRRTKDQRRSSFVLRPSSSYVHALDVSAERLKFAFDVLVAPVNLADVADGARAARAQCGDKQRHARADVRAVHLFAAQPGRAFDDAAVWVT